MHQQGVRERGYGVEGGNTPDSTEHHPDMRMLSDVVLVDFIREQVR